ncbi:MULTISPECIES: alpha/beta fold hydrolase [Candidatus Nitrosocaldus]|jgi:polyhydroxyalkanoate synthase|uniref:Poly(R)-hydroxyalkanoic acid synthase n=1 Tax=Candidatus Nitrosocaldus cavascurensis TaxID=2058097 RepID=A0A2K5APY0_9ARCH|nr:MULTISPECIES: alpha/beta fold hydrolase [Candidatus Nitrosocaldus]SPC33706.1 Poly(R)-hydroxyalkanoic acid synthase [Candidatus Nitrosocaldus cavascurensis]
MTMIEYVRSRSMPLPLVYNRLALEWMGVVSSMLKIYDTYSSIFYKALMMLLQEDGVSSKENPYMRMLNIMDAMLDEELKSERFAHLLTDYLDSWLSIHAMLKRIYPVRHYDIMLEDILAEQFRSYTRMLSFMLSTQNLPIDASGYDVVYIKGKVRLLHYRGGKGYPILIVYAMINRYHIMDVSKDKSVIRRLIEGGLDVYMLDWGHMGYEDEHLSLEDYIHILDEVVDKVREVSSKDRISMLGYCWGGIVSLIYASLYKQKLNSLIVMAAPVDFDKDDGILAVWAKAIDARRLVEEYGHMNGQALDIAFLLRNPVRYTVMKYLNLWKRINDRAFVETFYAVERWLYNTPTVPGRFYEQIIEDLYKGNMLVRGLLEVDGKRVDLKSIDIPLLTIVAENDDLTAPASTLAVNDHVSSKEKRVMSIPGGHVGLCISSIAHKQLWPNVARWVIEKARESSIEEANGRSVGGGKENQG